MLMAPAIMDSEKLVGVSMAPETNGASFDDEPPQQLRTFHPQKTPPRRSAELHSHYEPEIVQTQPL
jgi:hypothetical protein